MCENKAILMLKSVFTCFFHWAKTSSTLSKGGRRQAQHATEQALSSGVTPLRCSKGSSSSRPDQEPRTQVSFAPCFSPSRCSSTLYHPLSPPPCTWGQPDAPNCFGLCIYDISYSILGSPAVGLDVSVAKSCDVRVPEWQ